MWLSRVTVVIITLLASCVLSQSLSDLPLCVLTCVTQLITGTGVCSSNDLLCVCNNINGNTAGCSLTSCNEDDEEEVEQLCSRAQSSASSRTTSATRSVSTVTRTMSTSTSTSVASTASGASTSSGISTLITTTAPASSGTSIPSAGISAVATATPASSGSQLTTGAKIGIGVGATAGGLVALGAMAFLFFRMGQKSKDIRRDDDGLGASDSSHMHEGGGEAGGGKPELGDTGTQRFEKDGEQLDVKLYDAKLYDMELSNAGLLVDKEKGPSAMSGPGEAVEIGYSEREEAEIRQRLESRKPIIY